MANENPADKAKRDADEAARKDAEVKERADADAAQKARADADGKTRSEKTSADPSAKGPAPAKTSETPHPTQAELDAMRSGTYRHGREATAGAKGVDYKTR